MMIIPFSSLSIFAASKSEINKLVKYECENFGIENSTGIKNPFSRTDGSNKFCHMKN
jgi:hypothetical protein